MKVLISERLSEHKYKTPEGYLICTDAILARTGKQRYTKDELFGNGDSEEVDVDRPYEQVMNEKTISSFENKPVTFDHPDEDVNVGNYKEYAVGYVRDVRQGKVDGQDVILGNLVITDQDAIDAIENGEHTDLSCGYDCDIKDDGHGSYYQNNIRGNHVALCREGRAGNARIIDSKTNTFSRLRDSYVIEELPEDETVDIYIPILKKYNLKIQKLNGNKVKVIGNRKDIVRYYDKEIGIDEEDIGIKDNKMNDDSVIPYRGYNIISRNGYYFVEKDGQEYGLKTPDNRVLAFGRAVEAKNAIRWNRLTKFDDSKVKDAIMKDESEDWTEMLIKLAVKNGKNSSGDYEYDGDADVNQVRRVLKKLGYKANGYVKNPKSYLHKLHYYFTDSEILEDISSDPVVVKDDNLLGKRVRIRKRYSNLDGTTGTIYSYEGTNYDDEVEVKRNGHIYKVNYEDIEFLDSKVADSVNDAFNNGKLKDFRIEDLIRLVKERKEAVNSVRLDDRGNIYYIVVDGSFDTDLNTGKNASLDVVCEDKESHRQKRCIMLSRASSWKEIIATFNRWRNTIRDSIDDSIYDSLSASEKDLCDYMLENCREEDEDENDLLKKMKLYYSEYSSLARNKPNEVLNYFREHIDNFDDSIKDSNIVDAWSGTRNGIIYSYHNGYYYITHENGKVERLPESKFDKIEDLYEYVDKIKDSSNLSTSKALKLTKIVSMLHKK